MMRSCLFLLALACSLALPGTLKAAGRDTIIPETAAARHGLTRMWYSQVQLDRARARVEYVVLHGGTLFVQTDQAMLHALDAETGQTLWAVEVGRRGHPSLPPAANSDLVAVVNGSYLYIVNRHNGNELWQTQVESAPGAGPALSERRAYVPMVSGLVLSYLLEPVKKSRRAVTIPGEGQSVQPTEQPAEQSTQQQTEAKEQARRESLEIEQEKVPALGCQSEGRAIVQPIITRQNESDDYVAWPTDRGYLFVGRVDHRFQDQFAILYRLQTEAGIAAQPSYLPPDAAIAGDSGIIFAASRDGYVHAILENRGTALWRFSTGEPLVEPAVVVDQRVYAATQPGGLYSLDAKTGDQLWWSPQVMQFVAASRDRIYAVDRLGKMVVLDVKTGARLDAIPFPPNAVRMINDQTDRIYLVSDTGLVQCLREIENVEPVRHRVEPKPEPAKPAPKAEKPAAEAQQPPAPPAEGAAPNPFEGAGNPFDQ